MLARSAGGLSPVSIATMDEEIETSLWQERLLSAVSQLFGALAALIAASRLFGLIAFTSALRTREIGIRMALGATRESISTLPTVHATAVIAPCISIGCLGIFPVNLAFAR